MARYADQTWLGRIGVKAEALASITSEAKDAALDAASDLMDSYFRVAFTLPLITWQDDVRRACAIIAAYDLLVVRGYNPSAGADVNFRLRYEDIMGAPGRRGWLQQVAGGNAIPGVVDSSPGATEGENDDGPEVYSSSQRGWSTRGTTNRRRPFTGD